MAYNNGKNNKLIWFHTHRIRILIITAITVISLTLILLAYLGTYLTYNKVIFDEETNEKISSFEQIDDLEIIDLDFIWTTLKYPSFNEDGSVDATGYYQFKFSYDARNTYSVSKVTLTPVLQTNWIDYKELGTMITLSDDSYTNALIVYNYELPQRKLIFVNVEEPFLYLKIDVTYDVGSTTSTQTQYVKINLDDYNPDSVLD
ncbi:hypothetical protein KHQ89_03890 [Mycoplasmatota bacterium]|nr:hypothetical protein KHQ89_03890 [Mycoplasmatota bacterium]